MLARFPAGRDPRYVIAERRVLGRMLEARDAGGVTHALAALIARHPDRLFGVGCVDPASGRRPRGSSSAWSASWDSWARG